MGFFIILCGVCMLNFLSNIISAPLKFLGNITGSNQASKAGEQAAQTQADFSQQGIDEQQRQFDAIVAMMEPFLSAGTGALGGQQDLLGLQGDAAQMSAIEALQNSPQFGAMVSQGENAMLQNASATGGLRGGNIQQSLAQYRPQILSQMIESQLGHLGGLSALGQNAAMGQAGYGMNASTNISNLLGQQGSALAGGQLAAGGAQRQTFNDLLGIGNVVGGFL